MSEYIFEQKFMLHSTLVFIVNCREKYDTIMIMSWRVIPNLLPYFCNILLRYPYRILSYSVVCLTTVPKPLPKRFLHIVRSKASSFKWEYPLLSLRSSSSFLRLLPRLLVTSISPFIFPSITCFRRQFLRKMWPIQLAFRFIIACTCTYI